MTYLFLLYFGVLAASLIIGYLTGYGILFYSGSLPQKKYLAVFSSLFLGISTWVLLVSVAATRFQTINTGFLILFAWYWVICSNSPPNIAREKQKAGFSLKTHFLVIAELLVVAFLLFLYRFRFTYAIHAIPTVTSDLAFYGRLSYFILHFGRETIYPDFIYPETVRVLPYHYYELWLNAAIAWFFRVNNVHAFVLVTATIGPVLLWQGLCALFGQFRSVNLLVKAACFLLLFVTGIYLQFFSHLEQFRFAAGLELNVFRAPKLFPIYLLVTAAFLSFLNKHEKTGFLLLLALPVVSFSTAPGILGAIVLYAVYLFFTGKDRSLGRVLFWQAISVAAFIILFYWLLPPVSDSASSTPINISALWSAFSFPVFFKLIFQGLGYLFALYFLAGLLFFAYALFFKVRFTRPLLEKAGLLLLISAIALVVSSLLGEGLDTNQIFWNITIVILNLLLIVGFIWLYVKLKPIQKVFLVLPFFIYCLVCFFNTTNRMGTRQFYSDEYIATLARELPETNRTGAFIKDSTDYNSIYVKASAVYPMGDYFGLLQNEFVTVALSVYDMPLDSTGVNFEKEKFYVRSSSFHKFVTAKRKEGSFRSVEQSQADFLKAFNIGYLLVSKNAELPALIAPLVTKVVTDPLSGEKCYMLDPGKAAAVSGK